MFTIVAFYPQCHTRATCRLLIIALDPLLAAGLTSLHSPLSGIRGPLAWACFRSFSWGHLLRSIEFSPSGNRPSHRVQVVGAVEYETGCGNYLSARGVSDGSNSMSLTIGPHIPVGPIPAASNHTCALHQPTTGRLAGLSRCRERRRDLHSAIPSTRRPPGIQALDPVGHSQSAL